MQIRNTITAILLMFLAIPLQSQNFEDLDFGTDLTMEVMTWNLEWFPKNGEVTVGYVSGIIQALEVDIIALQELNDYDSFVQMVENLEGWEGVATSNGDLNLGYIYNPEFVEMTDIYRIYLDKDREFPRKPLVIEIVFMDEKYILINNHLKAFGDGYLNLSDPWDEETRRYDACILLNEYIETNFANDNVIVLGDFNDILTDIESNNVFQIFFNDPENYLFADMAIAEGPSANWSYPTWPSHIDHILITSELFEEFEQETTETACLRIDDFFDNGWSEYDDNVSDHRPVAIKFIPIVSNTGIGDVQTHNANLIISPNPFINQTTIYFEPAGENTSLEIFDFTGKKIRVYPVKLNQTSFEWKVNNLPSGLYHIHLKSNNRFLGFTKAVLMN